MPTPASSPSRTGSALVGSSHIREIHRAICGTDRITLAGIGISVVVTQGEARIFSIAKGSAAAAVDCTLRAGDLLLEIDGQKLPSLDNGPEGAAAIHERLVGERGSVVTISARQGQRDYTVSLVRSDVRCDAKTDAHLVHEVMLQCISRDPIGCVSLFIRSLSGSLHWQACVAARDLRREAAEKAATVSELRSRVRELELEAVHMEAALAATQQESLEQEESLLSDLAGIREAHAALQQLTSPSRRDPAVEEEAVAAKARLAAAEEARAAAEGACVALRLELEKSEAARTEAADAAQRASVDARASLASAKKETSDARAAALALQQEVSRLQSKLQEQNAASARALSAALQGANRVREAIGTGLEPCRNTTEVGMTLRADAGSVWVKSVAEGQAAAFSGLAPGAEVLAIDGTSLAGVALGAVQELLRGGPGAVARISARMEGREHAVRCQMAPILVF